MGRPLMFKPLCPAEWGLRGTLPTCRERRQVPSGGPEHDILAISGRSGRASGAPKSVRKEAEGGKSALEDGLQPLACLFGGDDFRREFRRPIQGSVFK